MPNPPARAGHGRSRFAQGALIFGAGVALFAAWRRDSAQSSALRRCHAERASAEARAEALRVDGQARVRTLLASIRSLTARTAERSEDISEFRAHFEGRLGVLARIHNIVARRGSGDAELEELVREELLTHAACTDDNCDVEGEAAALSEREAEALGLVLHELASNAVKYGALSTPDGRIKVRWSLTRAFASTKLKLEWIEMGVPALIVYPPESGFGRDLIEQTLPRELSAKTSLEFAPGGIRCRIELPLSTNPAWTASANDRGSGSS